MIPSSIFPQRPLPILAYHEKIKPALQAMDLFDTFQARRLNACRMAPPQYTTDAFINAGHPASNPIRLPNEIWIIVCRHANCASSKQLRLVNKALSDLAAKKLFTEVYVIGLPDSLQNLRKIAHHPLLSTFVKQMTYVIDRLDADITRRKDWAESAAHVSTYKLSPDTVSKHQHLQNLSVGQRKLIQSGKEQELLKECVALLPNLEDIDATSATALASEFGQGPQPIFGQLFRETLIDVYSLFEGGILENKFAFPHVALIKAFHHSNRSMRWFDMDEVPWAFWQDLEHTALFPQIKTYIQVPFANLKSLTISSWLGDMGRVAHGRRNPISRFIQFLSAAPQLESLQLWIQPANHALDIWDAEDTDLTDAFARLTWPDLRTFRINNCRIDRDAFIGFMERHAGCLRHLRLCTIELVDPVGVSTAPQPQGDDSPDDGPSAPGASWAFAIKHLAPRMNLCCADLTSLEDRFLERKSGGTVMIPMLEDDIDPEHWGHRSQWCEELGAYFVTKGKDWLSPLPVYGIPFYPKCPLCNKVIDGNESHFDEDDDNGDWEDEVHLVDEGSGSQEDESGNGNETGASCEQEVLVTLRVKASEGKD